MTSANFRQLLVFNGLVGPVIRIEQHVGAVAAQFLLATLSQA